MNDTWIWLAESGGGDIWSGRKGRRTEIPRCFGHSGEITVSGMERAGRPLCAPPPSGTVPLVLGSRGGPITVDFMVGTDLGTERPTEVFGFEVH